MAISLLHVQAVSRIYFFIKNTDFWTYVKKKNSVNWAELLLYLGALYGP